MLDSYIVSSVARISVDTAVEKLERLMEKLCGDASLKANEAAHAARMKPCRMVISCTIFLNQLYILCNMVPDD